MAKPKLIFPDVFLGCSFKQPEMGMLIEELNWLPWKIIPANTEIKSDQILNKIEDKLHDVDFAIFDITNWNPNVTLELGLAKGMYCDYFITNDSSMISDAPSDLKGIERIDYNWKNWKLDKSAIWLSWEFAEKHFRHNYYTKKVWKEIEHSHNADYKFYYACILLSQFKNKNKRLTKSEVISLSSGLFLNHENRQEVINILCKQRLLKRVRRNGSLMISNKLYKN